MEETMWKLRVKDQQVAHYLLKIDLHQKINNTNFT